MNVLLIAQCNKAALKETRRILDQFAERRGERTWQTAITWEGLKTLKRLLRKTARKNTAVACHWIRGLDHSELLWTVGNSQQFNVYGAVPTNTTQRNILRLVDENDWHSGEAIYLFSALASLLHDLGKSCDAFQWRLTGKPHHEGANLYRHEWISLRLFQAFVGQDNDGQWLARLSEQTDQDEAPWLNKLQKDGLDTRLDAPFSTLPPLAAAIAWLVMSHHRLPVKPEDKNGINADQFGHYFELISAQWNQPCTNTEPRLIKPYWTFSHGLPVTDPAWQKRTARIATRLLTLHNANPEQPWLNNLYLMHLARLSLMLADHHYSSLTEQQLRISHSPSSKLYANTNRQTGALNQSLAEHLLGVAINAGYISHSLPDLERSLPTLKNHKGLRKRSATARFRWQDKATDVATAIRRPSQQQGAFIINMASTGCGKTLANARIMYALAEPHKGARFSVALGLRTLTLQTGKDYQQQRMYLDEDQLAVRVGGSASRDLFDHYQAQAAATGSESIQDLIDEDGGVLFEGDYNAHPLLARTLHKNDIKALVAAPVLVCTVDHLTPATESQRGGRQIAPMLRLMTSDLVLDEIDDYGINDQPALTRLVHWAGLLGSRVMLSSATLPPALVQGLYEAYRAGREQYQANRGVPNTTINICCMWVDEHKSVTTQCATLEEFTPAHHEFVRERDQRLEKAVRQQDVRRVSELVPIMVNGPQREHVYQAFAEQMLNSALALHKTNHNLDPKTGKQVSFGLIRMANIEPLVAVALALFRADIPSDIQIHLCVYHSQFPLLMRSAIEHELDSTLKRNKPLQAFELSRIRQALDHSAQQQHLFIVLGSPVTEVGRDHDYDWAVVEPSSMRSMIQLVGRVRRHRPEPYLTPNIHLLRRNIKSFTKPQEPVFSRPGFETKLVKLDKQDLADILEQHQWQFIDSRPRIMESENLQQRESLVDIEHYQLQQTMLPQYDDVRSNLPAWLQVEPAPRIPKLGAHSWWSAPHATLMAILQQEQKFRDDAGQRRTELVLLPNAEEDDFLLNKIEKQSRFAPNVYSPVEDAMLTRNPDADVQGERIRPWFSEDYLTLLIRQAEQEELSLSHCAKKYGTLSLRESPQGWRFHPALGFSSAK